MRPPALRMCFLRGEVSRDDPLRFRVNFCRPGKATSTKYSLQYWAEQQYTYELTKSLRLWLSLLDTIKPRVEVNILRPLNSLVCIQEHLDILTLEKLDAVERKADGRFHRKAAQDEGDTLGHEQMLDANQGL